MKRLVIFGLMLASAFALTNCTEQVQLPDTDNDVVLDENTTDIESPAEDFAIPFEVYATASEQTKTVNNGPDTEWSANDKINVYHAAKGQTSFHKHSEFIIRNIQDGLFGGSLTQTLSASNDWYFLYPHSSSADTPAAAVVTIGGVKNENNIYVQTLTDGANSKKHIAGPNYPMYGYQTNVSKEANPRVQMRHLSSLIALKVVNQGDATKAQLENGDNTHKDGNEKAIKVSELTFTIPTISTKDANGADVRQTQIPIVGAFTVNVTGSEVTFAPVTNQSSNSVTLALPEDVTIAPGESATFYLAVRPFDANSITRTNTDPILEVSINGSKRTVAIPSGKANFAPGKVTTLRVPVKLSYPKGSDAVGKQSVGYDFITWENKRETNLYVNGEELKAYIVGENNKVGGLIIRGVVRDLINALDAGFFASTWQGKKAAMTVDNLNLWIPEYDNSGNFKKRTNFSEYEPLKAGAATAAYDMLGGGFFGGLAYAAVYVAFPYLIEDGIPREGDMLYLTRFMDPANITFSGVIENGYAEGTTDILILDENPIYKELGTAAVDKLLREKFDYVDASQNTYIPTFEGMYDIVNGISSDAATITAKAIYGKLESAIGTKEVTVSSYKLKLAPVFKAVFPSESEMTRMLGDIEVAIKITTYPFGTETSYNPIIFWGLDAYGPNASSPNL